MDLLAQRKTNRRIGQTEVIEKPLFVQAHVFNSIAISINSGANTALTFDSERYDTDGMHTGGSPGRLTCTRAGKHQGGTSIEFASNSTGIRSVLIRLNGATFIAAITVMAVNGDATRLSLPFDYDMIVGDYVEVVVAQTSGGPLNVTAAGNYSPEFWMRRAPD